VKRKGSSKKTTPKQRIDERIVAVLIPALERAISSAIQRAVDGVAQRLNENLGWASAAVGEAPNPLINPENSEYHKVRVHRAVLIDTAKRAFDFREGESEPRPFPPPPPLTPNRRDE
jgi:hypothetical protein